MIWGYKMRNVNSSRSRRLWLAGGVAFAAIVTAQNALAEDAAADEVVVTGTRALGRTVLNSAAPVDVVSHDALEETGRINLVDALNEQLPSLNLPANIQPDLGSIVRGAQLRGLDPDFTLVLVNGKRRHSTALVNEDGFPGSVATDLSLIPTEAIDHIEVLRDGASAIYGSDAVAGVINVILKSNSQGGEGVLQAGQTYKGDGANGQARLNFGEKLGDRGFINLSVELDHQDRAVRNLPLIPTYLSYPAISNTTGKPVALGANDALPAGASPSPAEATRNSDPWQNLGQIAYNTQEAEANLGYTLANNVQLYAFGTFSHRVAKTGENFRLPAAIFKSNVGLLSVYPDGFTPFEGTNEKDYSFTAGAKGLVIGWDWDLSTTYGVDDLDVYTKHSANYSLTYPGAQTDFYDGNRTYSDWTTNLDFHRGFTLAALPKPVDVNLGVEGRRETDQESPGEPNSYFGSGASSLVGYLPADAVNTNRSSYAGYVGLSTYLTPKWFVDVAGRAEHYSDFGGNLTGKFSTRYDFNDAFALRGTIANGFHAPSLVTESYSNTSDHAGTPYRLAQPSSTAPLALGASPLQPEKSTSYTVGFTSEPLKGVHLAVDTYLIDVSNRLGTSSSVGVDYSTGLPVDGSGKSLTAAQAAYITGLLQKAGLTVGQGLVVHYFTNVGDTRTFGVDFTADTTTYWSGVGSFRWNFGLNLNNNALTRATPLPAVLLALPNIVGLSNSAKYSLLYTAPRDKEVFGVVYRGGKWTIDLHETRFGNLRRLNGNTNTPYDLDPSYNTDLSVAYDITTKLKLTVIANNLLDQYPQKTPVAALSAGTIAQYGPNSYSNSGPQGVIGGQYYVRLAYKF